MRRSQPGRRRHLRLRRCRLGHTGGGRRGRRRDDGIWSERDGGLWLSWLRSSGSLPICDCAPAFHHGDRWLDALATSAATPARLPPRESRDSSPELAMVFLIFLPRLQVGSAARGFRLASRGPAFPVPRQLKGRRAQPVLSRAPAGTMCQALGCCWAELSPASPPPMARMIGGLRSALATAAHWSGQRLSRFTRRLVCPLSRAARWRHYTLRILRLQRDGLLRH